MFSYIFNMFNRDDIFSFTDLLTKIFTSQGSFRCCLSNQGYNFEFHFYQKSLKTTLIQKSKNNLFFMTHGRRGNLWCIGPTQHNLYPIPKENKNTQGKQHLRLTCRSLCTPIRAYRVGGGGGGVTFWELFLQLTWSVIIFLNLRYRLLRECHPRLNRCRKINFRIYYRVSWEMH